MSTPPMRPTALAPVDQDEDHSPIGFSGWDRHSACVGSVALSTLCPKPASSAAADEGTVAHSVAAYWLINGNALKGVDTVMENNLRAYVYAVWDRLPKVRMPGKHHIYMVESRVAAPKIHEDCRGTADALIWDDVTQVLQIHDLKYGGYPVDAVGNQQLQGYAMCALETWPHIKPKSVELYIHQVRISKEPKKWVIDPLDLDMFRDDVIDTVAEIEKQKKILKKTKDPKKLTLNAGDHCHFCPAKLICHERKEAAKREGIDVLMPVPARLPKDSGVLVRFAIKALPFAKGVIAAAVAHLKKGGKIPGVKFIQGNRVRIPVDPETLEDELTTEVDLGGIGLSEDDIVVKPKPKTKTLAQIAEIVPKKRKEAFDKLWKWAPGAPKLVLEETEGKLYKVSADDYFKVIGDKSGEEGTEEDV